MASIVSGCRLIRDRDTSYRVPPTLNLTVFLSVTRSADESDDVSRFTVDVEPVSVAIELLIGSVVDDFKVILGEEKENLFPLLVSTVVLLKAVGGVLVTNEKVDGAGKVHGAGGYGPFELLPIEKDGRADELPVLLIGSVV